jgi:hypothetical protein
MDFKAFFSDRLAKLEKYLSNYRSDRKYALGRVLEIESLAFSVRNEGLLSLGDFDRLDLQCETLRRRFQLHANYSDFKSDRPYNGRFLDFESDDSQPGQQAPIKPL